MSNPNEVMDVDTILLAPFMYGIQSDFIQDKEELAHRIKAFQASKWFKEPKIALDRYIAQQNAALLRSLLDKKEVMTARNGFGPSDYYDTEAIPASILEAKLNELESV